MPNNYENTITINSDYENNKIKEIQEVSHIKINTEEEFDNVRDSTIVDITPKEDKSVVIERTATLSNFSELNQYSDKMLQYELNRMMGFK